MSSDGTLDVINDAASNNTETSLTVTDYENIQVTGVTASNLNDVNNALANVSASSLPLTVAQIQALVNSLSVETNNIIGLKVYPNPVSDVLHISVGNGEKLLNVAVYDVVGKRVLNMVRNQLLGDVANLDTSHLQNGVYLVKIKTNNGQAVQEIFVNWLLLIKCNGNYFNACNYLIS